MLDLLSLRQETLSPGSNYVFGFFARPVAENQGILKLPHLQTWARESLLKVRVVQFYRKSRADSEQVQKILQEDNLPLAPANNPRYFSISLSEWSSGSNWYVSSIEEDVLQDE